ncbi:ATP-binding protein [uncultured Mobiluncus sp.]|uniref:ATP-binding protein n=1 Tax=uncultured Mobiluncus sp. TaxID=293425 RepID=UPI00262DCFF2|nr:ATP-binding protein [uncultured Mobiluncus sp.]
MNKLIPRDSYLHQLRAIDAEDSAQNLVRILTGVRRSGKSSLLALYEDYLVKQGIKPAQIMSVNFEDLSQDRLRDARTFHSSVQRAIEEQGIRFLHIDEAQELDDWARVLNSLREKYNLRITVTGSNASLFAGEGLTYLAGRYIAVDVLPLSLGEYRNFAQIPDSTPPEQAYARWMRATLPAPALMTNSKVRNQAMNSVFDSIFARDIVTRGQLRDTDTFMKVARFVFDNAGSPISPGRIATRLESQGIKVSPQSVDRFLGLMVDAHMFYPCRRYQTRGGQWLRTGGKYYFIDPGLRDVLLGHKQSNTGHDLENMVFLELLRRGYQVSSADTPKGEIDFFATHEGENRYIQVALTVLDSATLARELRPFEALPPGSSCTLLTMDRLPLNTGAVQHLNAADFLAGAPLNGGGNF